MINHMNNSDRIESLLSYHKNNTLVRNVWHGVNAMNQETACWLGALGKDITSSSKCPAELMPAWLARLLPSFDDNVSHDNWQAFTDQYVQLAQQWHVLTPDAWSRVHTETMLCSLNIALPHNEKAVAPVIALYERRKAGNEPSVDQWKQAAADAAAGYAAYYAANAAYYAANAAYYAANAAYYAARAAYYAANAAKSQAWDKICKTTFDAIQKEIELAS